MGCWGCREGERQARQSTSWHPQSITAESKRVVYFLTLTSLAITKSIEATSPDQMRTLCAICGVKSATTKDHIPPQSLYPKPRANDINLNTVPACAGCNNGAAFDDEIFKVLIGIDTGEHQADRQKIIDSLAGTIGKNARVAGQVFSNKKKIFAGLRSSVLEPAVEVTFDFKPYERVIIRAVKGLHWMETGKCLHPAATYRVLPGAQLTRSHAAEWMSLMMNLPLKKLNKDSFAYRYHIGSDGCHAWGMQFFTRHTTFVMVQEPVA